MKVPPGPAREVAQRLGQTGVWCGQLSLASAAEGRSFAQSIESLGFGALWVSEGIQSKEIFSHAALLLCATEQVVIGTGIANIHARDPQAMMNGGMALEEAFPGRFVLGLGVSHAPRVEARGGSYERPLSTMKAYLERMTQSQYGGPKPAEDVPRLLGALGPKMSQLGADMTLGVLPYFVPADHVRQLRNRFGPDPLVAVEVMVVADGDPRSARGRARSTSQKNLAKRNYYRHLLRLGYSESDLADGGSDRLIDDVIAWGDAQEICEKLSAYREAGADHICIQVLDEPLSGVVDILREFREL